LRGSRNKLSEEVICALLRDFREHGQKAIAQVRRKHPAAYLKILALLVPKEMKLEHTNRLASLTDEQLDQAIEAIEEMLARQSGEAAKVIEGEAEVVPSLPAPARPTKAS
jgi:histidinol dehydrogenase